VYRQKNTQKIVNLRKLNKTLKRIRNLFQFFLSLETNIIASHNFMPKWIIYFMFVKMIYFNG